MKTPLAIVATLVSALALYLPTRTQAFTRVMVDGRNVRMFVSGKGDATVVFESGLGGSLEHWGKVQPAVSGFAKTVSYDRAGMGLSDAGWHPRDGRRIATELHDALRAAGIAPPYVLVGHSLGGPYVRVFAAMFPDEAAGLVLVDPTPDSEVATAPREPEHRAMPATLAQARAGRIPSGIPVFLIDAVPLQDVPFATDAIRTVRARNRVELAAESIEYAEWLRTIPGSRLITVNSGHNIPQEQPAAVIEAIRKIVDEIRLSRP
jgi:pimeloyl-ACP methyl ester carboxylesterase